MRGLRISEPKVVERIGMGPSTVATIAGVRKLKSLTWTALNLSESDLRGLRFSGCTLDNCVFDHADCRGWRAWQSAASHCDFRGADLRGAALGAIQDNQQNLFSDVDFSRADFRGATFTAAKFVRCKFSDAKLEKVNFGGSAFVDCTFEGTLTEVIFNRTAFNAPKLPANEMTNVDFRRAKFKFVEFRGVSGDSILWPDDPNHLIVANFRTVLDALIREFEGESAVSYKALVAVLRMEKKWSPASQKTGVLSRADVLELAGGCAWDRVLATVAKIK